MTTSRQQTDISGERKGRNSSVYQRIFALSFILIALLPQAAVASTTYLKNNTGTFLLKIDESYGQMIDIAALLHDYDSKLITAVIVVESEGITSAVSNKGAKGLMQLMPGTAKAMGASDPKDPFQNILAGTKYLKELEQRYGFTPAESLVAYNMGPSRAKRWLSQYEPDEYGYVQKVMYVYGVLAQMELDEARLAKGATAKYAIASTESARPMMTKPRSISFASIPLSLPLSRRGELVTE